MSFYKKNSIFGTFRDPWFQGLKLLLDDGHVIQEQVKSEKYQGTLVFVRHTDHVAGLGFLQGERVQTVKELLGERGLKNKYISINSRYLD